VIHTIALFQWVCLLLNLALFLAFQITYMMLIIADLMTIIHWGDQGLSHKLQMSSIDWKWRIMFRTIANLHWKNRWKEDYDHDWQIEHIDGKLQHFSISMSSVGTLSSINLQIISDLEGGTCLHHMSWAHLLIWNLFIAFWTHKQSSWTNHHWKSYSTTACRYIF
jgi:hypothetical protein